MSEIEDRIADYFGMGVRDVWVIDPWKRRILAARGGRPLEAVSEELTVAETDVRVPVSAVFVELDRRQGCG